MLGLGQIIYVALLLVNAVAILNEERFLAREGTIDHPIEPDRIDRDIVHIPPHGCAGTTGKTDDPRTRYPLTKPRDNSCRWLYAPAIELGTAARMNLPGRPDGNWQWRYRSGALTDELSARLRDITILFARHIPPKARPVRPPRAKRTRAVKPPKPAAPPN